jgi:hypothetical protein
MDWQEYQEQTASVFRSLGCEADVEALVKGVRTDHKIDVWVRFKRFGLETKWAVECKCWATAVTQEKVMALKAIVDDIGADRGILISTAGFQSGAVRAAEKTNITLTDLDFLKNTANEDLSLSVIHTIEVRTLKTLAALHGLHTTEKIANGNNGQTSWVSKPRTGVDGQSVIRAIGALSLLRMGFDQVRLKTPPYVIPLDFVDKTVAVDRLEDFAAGAVRAVEEAERVLNSQPIEKLGEE